MSMEHVYIDASDDPTLSRVAREVRDSRKKHIIRLDDEDVAIISPIRKRRKGRTISKEDYEAFLSALGGWKDVDTDKLIEDIYAARRAGDRPPVKL